MDVLHDRLIWQVLSGGHAFSPLRTDYRKTHASYPLGTASNPLGSAPALLLVLIHRSAWNGDSRKFATATADCDDVEPCARHIAHASLRLCSDIRLRSKIARRLPFCPMVRGDRASQKMPLLPS